MTFATHPSPRVRPSSRRPTSRRHRSRLRQIAGGLAATAIVLFSLSAALIGAGRLVAVSRDGSAAGRPSIALAAPPNRFAILVHPSTGAMPRPVFIADASWLGTEPVSFTRLARAADPDITGALGASAAAPPEAPAMVQVASAGPTMSLPPLPEPPPIPRVRPRLASLPPAAAPGDGLEETHPPRTAIYDITAQTVYLPNGETLEAHSGLGALMDDPRHTRIRMRGATPPNTYRLTLRESLFHGVQAIRLNPVNQSAMYGRDGILAHTYMLGPSGQSNGCVSFKDYPRFLRAFMRGEVDRMVVVAKLDRPPMVAGRKVRSAENTARLTELVY